MQTNCIKNLLDLKGVMIKNIKNLKDKVEIYIELPIKEHICPCCGKSTTKVHDYYTQTIRDIPIYFKPTNLIYHKRRYECKYCGKNFFEDNSIISKYQRRTTRLTGFVVDRLRNLVSQSDVSKQTNVSTSVISKMLPLCRQKHFLCEYFKHFPKEQLDNVKYFVTDLLETYKNIAFTYFRKAKIIAVHFHFARYACNAVNDIRIAVQKSLPKNERKYFKHSRKLLLSRQCNLKTDEQKDELSYILINYSEDLRIAYTEKEALLDIIHSTDSFETKSKSFSEWVKRNLESPIEKLRDCAKTYQHWYIEIKNSLNVPYSNGATEGFNNKIKVLKRVSFGMRSFKNFKARILLLNR